MRAWSRLTPWVRLRWNTSRLRVVLAGLVGLVLVAVLHACQASPSANVSTSPSAVTSAVPQPEAAADQADASPAAPKGFYNPPRGDVRLVAISDLNEAYGSTSYSPEVDRAIALLPFWKPDMVVCSGDMVAGQSPTLTDDTFGKMWAAFDQHVAAKLRQAKLPYGFTVGNHDASSATSSSGKFLFQRERDATAKFWRDPAHDPGVQFVDRFEYPFYYTFEHQGIFFVAWDGSSSKIPAEKLAWVEQALASPQAQAAKLRILLGHLPLYSVAVGRDEAGEVMDNADQLRSLLEKYQVHTYISGHHHTYYPAHRGKLQLLHMGILGSGPRPYIDNKLPPRKSLTVIDINFNTPELTTYTTYDMRTLQLIQYKELPRFLAGHNGITLRRDVEGADLTAQEKSFCLQRLDDQRCSA